MPNKRRSIAFSWRSFLIFLFFYRCAFSIFGEIVVARATRLGDSKRYIGAGFTLGADAISAASGGFERVRSLGTVLNESLAAVFALAVGGQTIAIHLAFQCLGFLGIYKILMVLEGKERKIAALLVLSPTFTLWSSVTSKEAIVVCCLGIVLSAISRSLRAGATPKIYELAALLILGIYKIHYIIAILFLWFGVALSARFKQKAVVALAGALVSMIPLYVFRERIDKMAFQILPHFKGVGDFTREPFWTEQYDVFVKAPYGMFQTFFGPTVEEAFAGPFQMISFIESLVILAILCFVLISRLPRIPVYSAIMSACAVFWMLFPNYPLGIMNAGSSVRYRTGYLLFIAFCVLVMTSRGSYVRWLQGRATRKVLSRPSVAMASTGN